MDINQEEMQLLTLFDIYKEAYKIVSLHKKIFNKITIYLILPLSFLLLAEVKLSNTLFAMKLIIHNNVNEHNATPINSTCNKLSNNSSFSDDMTNSWLFKVGYYTLILVFSSFSTAAVVYSTTCAYFRKEVTFKKVKNFISKVWKRVMINLLCGHISICLYIRIFQIVLEWVRFFPHNLYYSLQAFGCKVRAVSFTHNQTYYHWSNQILNWIRFFYYIGLMGVFTLLFVSGLVYISIIFQIASVVSVLEEEEGNVIKAMMRSKQLVKGKIWINTAILLTMSLFITFTRGEYGKLFVHVSLMDMVVEVPLGMLCFWFLCQLILFGFTVQTVTYFVCKSFHHESMDPSSLLDNIQIHPHDNLINLDFVTSRNFINQWCKNIGYVLPFANNIQLE